MSERKADRTRRRITETALALFDRYGYAATTMERVATDAEVGTSTLYRYFPSKDLILIEALGDLGDLVHQLAARPRDEALPEALAHSIAASLALQDRASDRVLLVRRLLDGAPVPRSRLWDVMARSRQHLAEAIAARTGDAPDAVAVQLTARLTMTVAELAADRWRAHQGRVDSAELLEEILGALRDGSVTLPAGPLPAGPLIAGPQTR